MAIWQFSLHLLPRPRLMKHFGDVPACLDRDLWETADFEHWGIHALPEECSAVLDEVLPRMEDHWCETVTAWGSYDGNVVEVSYEGDYIESFRARIDLREADPRFLRAICQVGAMSDCYLLTEDMRLIEARMDLLVQELRQSSAFQFVSDPKRFLESFHGMPRFD